MLTRLLLVCSLSAAVLCAQNLPPIRSWAEAEKLEAELDSHADDMNIRVQLLRYYTQQGASRQPPSQVKPLRRKQILWFIEHHPEQFVLADQTGMMDPFGYPAADPEGFAECSAAWQKALISPKPLFDTFANAVAFYRTANPARARRIAKDGLKRYPGNARISLRMGMLMAHAILGVKTVDLSGRAASFDEAQTKSRQAAHDRKALETSDDTNLIQGAAFTLQQQTYPLNSRHLTARLHDVEELIVRLYEHANEIDPNMGRWQLSLMIAYRQFASVTAAPAEKIAFLEKALAAAPNPSARISVLPDLSREYLSAGNRAKAAEAANELLNADQDTRNRNGSAMFTAHTVLGRIALRQGDAKEAASHLLAAGRVLSTPQPTSFGPGDWSLAEELLAAGDRDPVLAYLDLLRNLWKNDNGRLNTWASTIRSGGTPHFNPNAFPTSQYVGRPAPEFRLKDLHGAEVALGDFKGKVVLLDFWATWCEPCRQEMPEFQRIHRELAAKDVVVLALDVDEPLETAAGYMDREKFTFPVLLANGASVMDRYGVHSYPTTFAIDQNGLVADVIVGGGSESASRLQALIERARAGAPPGLPVSLPASAPVFVVSSARGPVIVLGKPSQQSCAPFGCPWLLTEARPPLAGFQQVYDASGFGTEPILITAITFYAKLDRPGTITPATYTFRLASTDARVGGLSRDRNQNLGRDAAVFWSGVLDGDVSDTFTITATTPFPFEPDAGNNLLLDIGISGQPVAPRATPFGFFDRDIAGSALTSCTLFVSDTSGFYNASGLVTGFTVSPANGQAANR